MYAAFSAFQAGLRVPPILPLRQEMAGAKFPSELDSYVSPINLVFLEDADLLTYIG